MSRTVAIAAGIILGVFGIVLIFGLLVSRAPGWEFTVSRDPMTDQVSAFARKASRDGLGMLSLECEQGGDPRIYFLARQRLTGFSPNEQYLDRGVTYRVDDAPPRDAPGGISDNIIGFGDIGRDGRYPAQELVDALPTASRLAIEVYDHQGRRVVMGFDASGAGEMIERLNDACSTS